MRKGRSLWEGLDGVKGRGKWHNYNTKRKEKWEKRIYDIIWELSTFGSIHGPSPSELTSS